MWCGEEYGVEGRRVIKYYRDRPSAQLPFHDPVTRMLSRILTSPASGFMVLTGSYWGKCGSPLEGSERALLPRRKAMSISPGTRL